MNYLRLDLVVAALAIGLVLTGCAGTADLKTEGIDKTVTAQFAQRDIKAATGQRVLWGGMIMGAKNLPGKTEIEVLAFPLDDWHRPNETATATVRFLAEHEGYLELIDYARGRWLTLTGTVQGARAGTVGEAPYDFPLVHADGLHLWPKDEGRGSSSTQFHFGVGIGVYK